MPYFYVLLYSGRSTYRDNFSTLSICTATASGASHTASQEQNLNYRSSYSPYLCNGELPSPAPGLSMYVIAQHLNRTVNNTVNSHSRGSHTRDRQRVTRDKQSARSLLCCSKFREKHRNKKVMLSAKGNVGVNICWSSHFITTAFAVYFADTTVPRNQLIVPFEVLF